MPKPLQMNTLVLSAIFTIWVQWVVRPDLHLVAVGLTAGEYAINCLVKAATKSYCIAFCCWLDLFPEFSAVYL